MIIRFKKAVWKNFLSYGNNLTMFDFTNGVHLICGNNGMGKSVLVDVIYFGLKGKAYRKVKIGDLVNRYNKKNLYVCIEFAKGNDDFKVERGVKPNFFKITKNGVELPESDANLQQDEFEKNILGFDEKVVRQLILLGSTYHTPFLRLDSAGKRNMIEWLFDLDIIQKMKKKTKEKIDLREKDFENLEHDKKLIDNNIFNIKDELDRSLRHNQKQQELFDERKRDIGSKLERLQTDRDNLMVRIEQLKEKKDSYKERNFDNDIRSIRSMVDVIRLQEKDEMSAINEKSDAVIDELQKKIKDSELSLNEVNENLSSIRLNLEKNVSLCEKKWDKDRSTIKSNILLLENSNDISSKKLEFFKNNAVCSTCGSDLSGEKTKEIIKTEEIVLTENAREIENQKELIKNIDEKENDGKNKLKEKFDCKDKELDTKRCAVKNFISSLNDKIVNAKKEKKMEFDKLIEKNKQTVDELQFNIEKIEKDFSNFREIERDLDKKENELKIIDVKIESENKNFNALELSLVDVVGIEKKLEKERTSLLTINKKMDNLQIVLEYLQATIKMLADDGVKSYIIKKFVPILNKKVQEYLTLFDASYRIEFTQELDIKIFDRSEEIDYDSFSGGERQRIDLSVMFSMMSFASLKSRIISNLVIFDEILDSSLDEEGIDSFFSILNVLATNNKDFWVISHRPSNTNRISDIYEVTKKDLFSEVNKNG